MKHIPVEAKTVVKRVISASLFYGGYYDWLIRREGKDKAIILRYHRISDPVIEKSQEDCRTNYEIGVDKNNFEAQIKYIKEKMHPLPLGELVESLRNKVRIPNNAVAVTFDDGYQDNYENAYPILKKYGVPATFFLAPVFIETGEVFWWDRVYEAIRKTKVKDIPLKQILGEFQCGYVDEHRTILTTEKAEEKRTISQKIVDLMKEIDQKKINDCVEHLESALGVNGDDRPKNNLMLTWAQIKEMRKNNMSFGSHTMSHPILTNVPLQSAKIEIEESKRVLEEQLGERIDGFAYPEGKSHTFNNEIKYLLKELGMKYACSTEPGFIDSRADFYELKRVGMPNKGLSISLMDLTLALNIGVIMQCLPM